MIFVSEDIGKNNNLVCILDQPHGNPGHRLSNRHTGIHKGKTAAADRGHGRGTIGLQHLRHNTNRIRKFFTLRKHRLYSTCRESAVPYIPAARASQEACLTDTIRREIIMKHKRLKGHAIERLDPLLVFAAAQGGRHHGLGLSAGKKRRAVHTGQRRNFAFNRPHLVKTPAVNSGLVRDDHVAHHSLLHIGQEGLALFEIIRLRIQCVEHLLAKLVIQFAALHLVRGGYDLLHVGFRNLCNAFFQCFIDRRQRHLHLGPANRFQQFLLHVEDGLHSGMPEIDAV